MKGDKMTKRSSFGSVMRKRLSDITNSLPQPKSPHVNLEIQSPVDSLAKEQIDNLVKENMALVALIQEKNKIIELSGLELQKLRIGLQKMQLQNWNLAQSNSHMLAELNLGKEKLKSIQHELMCKEALLKAKPKEPERLNIHNVMDGVVAMMEPRANEDKRSNNSSRRHHPMRSRSMGSSSTPQQVTEQTEAENKRRCVRRKSASYRMQPQEPPEDLFEIEDAKLTNTRTPVHIKASTPSRSSINCEAKDGKHSPGSKSKRASSLGRPLRRAALKVQNYKEVPVNVKMRRAE